MLRRRLSNTPGLPSRTATPPLTHEALAVGSAHVAAAVLICLALVACATAPTAKTVCPAIRAYQPADVAALTAELKTIDRHGPVAQAVVEYRRLRDELRACQATQ